MITFRINILQNSQRGHGPRPTTPDPLCHISVADPRDQLPVRRWGTDHDLFSLRARMRSFWTRPGNIRAVIYVRTDRALHVLDHVLRFCSASLCGLHHLVRHCPPHQRATVMRRCQCSSCCCPVLMEAGRLGTRVRHQQRHRCLFSTILIISRVNYRATMGSRTHRPSSAIGARGGSTTPSRFRHHLSCHLLNLSGALHLFGVRWTTTQLVAVGCSRRPHQDLVFVFKIMESTPPGNPLEGGSK